MIREAGHKTKQRRLVADHDGVAFLPILIYIRVRYPQSWSVGMDKNAQTVSGKISPVLYNPSIVNGI